MSRRDGHVGLPDSPASRWRRPLVLLAGGAIASVPLSASAVAAPAACACGGGGGGGAAPAPAPSAPLANEVPPDAQPPPARLPAPPVAASPPAPRPQDLPRTPDAAERWLDDDEPVAAPDPPPAPEPVAAEVAPAPAPQRQVYGVNSDLYRRLGAEDQQTIRDGYESRDAAPPAPEPPAPEPVAAPPPPAPPPETGPGPQIYGVDADLYRRLGAEDQQAIREAVDPQPAPQPGPAPAYLPQAPDAAERQLEPDPEAEPPPPSAPDSQYTPCSPVEPYQERVCIEHPAETHHSGGFWCVPGEGPAEDSCRTLVADEIEDPSGNGAIYCEPAQGPYIGTRPCGPGEPPPPSPPAFEQGPTASDDYEGWLDPARRGRERTERFDEALPTAREWDTGDFQERDQGRLRFGLFIASESESFLGVDVEGDNRSFDPQFSPHHSRAYVEVDFENDRAYVVANPTCDPGGGCNDAKHIGDGAMGDYSSEVTLENRDDGSIYIQYELSNARLPAWIPFASGPSIDGHITIRPNSDESFTVDWYTDPFPSVEAYFDDGCGVTWTVEQDEETNPTGLNPFSRDRDFTIRVPVQGDAGC